MTGETISAFLLETPPAIAYLCLGLAGASEYIVPPLPGDTFALVGIFLCTVAGYDPCLVYLSLTAGSAAGGQLAYGAGLWLGRNRERWPAFLRRQSAAMGKVEAHFAKRGAIYLTFNRFIPAFRALFFVAAGTAKLPWQRVLLFGSLSAALWNALLFALAYTAGQNWQRLETLAATYGRVAFACVALGLVAYLTYRWRKGNTKS